MNYDDIAAHFLVPSADAPPTPALPISKARVLRDALEPIATIGWWARAASEEWTSLGHGFFDGYVWGRAAALGADVAPSVVVSAFGVFSPALLVPVYEQGRSTSSRDAVLAAREAGAIRGLTAATNGVEPADIKLVGDRLMSVLGSIEPGPRHLFGALQSVSTSADPYARLWRGAELYREHRGDSHLAACVAADLCMAEMNVLTEVWLGYPVGEYSASRGFVPEQLQAAAERLQSRGWFTLANAMTDAGKAAREAIELNTDVAQQRVVDALSEEEQAWSELVATANRIGAAVLAAQAAPADPRKRAAG
jgi:hypothetical protein